MAAIEWIRFGIVIVLLVFGMSIFFLEIFGVYRFKFVLNRMQIAATGDTLGIGLCLIGLMVANGWDATTAKLALVIVFLWCAYDCPSGIYDGSDFAGKLPYGEHGGS